MVSAAGVRDIIEPERERERELPIHNDRRGMGRREEVVGNGEEERWDCRDSLFDGRNARQEEEEAREGGHKGVILLYYDQIGRRRRCGGGGGGR